MSKHTPGPWYALSAGTDHNAEPMAYVTTTVGPHWPAHKITDPLPLPNARLIAAAPDLLAAAEAAAAHFADTDAPLGGILRAAISRARGEE